MDQIVKETRRKLHRNIIVFIVLVGLFVLASVFFVRSLESSYHSGQLRIDHRNQETTTQKLSDIRPWMTFDYINVVFKLPTDYLQNKLNITDYRYPNIRVDRYALHHGLNPNQLLFNIEQLIIQKGTSQI